MRHEFSTYAIILFITVMTIAILSTGFDIGDIPEVCNETQIAKVVGGVWNCSDDLTGIAGGDIVTYEKFNGTDNVTVRFNGTGI